MSLPEPIQQVDRTWVRWRGQTLAYFGGCDYYRLASHPRVLEAAENAIHRYGLNVAASRKTTGNHQLYEDLERELAYFFESEKALLISNGYLTNLAVIQGIKGRFDRVQVDEKAHSSLADAAAASGLAIVNEMGPRTLRLAESVRSHDGSIAPLERYAADLPSDSWLLVDDSHGAGVVDCVPRHPRVIRTTTLSKAFGCFGGAIIASAEICAEIEDRSGAFGGSTPFPLPYAAAAATACQLLKEGVLQAALRENLARLNLATPILSRSPGSKEELAQSLLARGIFPTHIRYQNGPPQGYFRFAISSEHTRAQIEALKDAVAEC